jgi:hypothetical protein
MVLRTPGDEKMASQMHRKHVAGLGDYSNNRRLHLRATIWHRPLVHSATIGKIDFLSVVSGRNLQFGNKANN